MASCTYYLNLASAHFSVFGMVLYQADYVTCLRDESESVINHLKCDWRSRSLPSVASRRL